MRHVHLLILVLAVSGGIGTTSAAAQTTARERAASLRLQLVDVETKQAALQTRLGQLVEDMKPENIEKSLAGIGSTRPEDVREQRQKQLEIERKGVQTQLDLLTTSHARLETAIAQADNDAYRESAGIDAAGTLKPPGVQSPPPQSTVTQPSLATPARTTSHSGTVHHRRRRSTKPKSRPRPASTQPPAKPNPKK